MKIMNRFKELREDKDLLQIDISRILNVSQQQYSRYESEESIMSYEQLIDLANFYEVSIDYLLYRTDVRKPYPKSLVETNDKSKDEKNNRISYKWDKDK